MIKVTFLNDSSQGLGGGWTFLRNLKKSFEYYLDEIKYVNTIEECDIAFVAGATMVTRQTIDKVQQLGKKLVVRLDNVPRNSRNRNTGTSRLKEFAERADAVVWQCEWAKFYLEDFIKPKKETIIYNGVDTEIFKPEGSKYDFQGSPVYLYSRYNRDETKRFEWAWYRYQLIHRENNNAKLVLVGNFSPEQIEYNFDFFRGEKVEYRGIIEDPYEMAKIYRGSDLFMATYSNDCFSNTYLEFLATKNDNKLFEPDLSGGTKEMVDLWNDNGRKFFTLERMGRDYYNFFKEL